MKIFKYSCYMETAEATEHGAVKWTRGLSAYKACSRFSSVIILVKIYTEIYFQILLYVFTQNLCVEGLFEKLQLHMIMAKKKKKKKEACWSV